MRTAAQTIPGIAEPIAVDHYYFRPLKLVVGDDDVRVRRGQADVPGTAGGTVPVQVKAGLFFPHPKLVVHGTTYETGPEVPTWLVVLSLVPMLLLFVGGLLGAVVGVVGAIANQAVIRREMSRAGQIGAIAGITVGVIVIYLVLVTLVFGTTQS